MNIEQRYPVMIFKRENNYGTFYTLGLSKKNREGEYVNGYVDCRFKKDVVLDNQTKINIKNAWLDFYVKDKRTITYIFISDFEIVDNNNKQDVYATFGETTDVQEENIDLPF